MKVQSSYMVFTVIPRRPPGVYNLEPAVQDTGLQVIAKEPEELVFIYIQNVLVSNYILKSFAKLGNQIFVSYSISGPPRWIEQPEVDGGYSGCIDRPVFDHFRKWELRVLDKKFSPRCHDGVVGSSKSGAWSGVITSSTSFLEHMNNLEIELLLANCSPEREAW